MKFTTTNQQLKEALKRLGFAINNKSSIMPVIANILVTVTDGVVLLTTTDLMVTINYQLTGTTSGEGQFLIPFTLLKNITALEEGEVTIEWNETKGAVVMFATDTFCLGNPGAPADFPKIPKVPGKGMFDLNTDVIKAMQMASLSVSKDELRPALTNMCIELNKDSVVVTSTDTHAIYTNEIKAEVPVEEKTELLVPVVIAKVLHGFQTLKAGFNKNHMAFESGPVLITTKRAEGTYVPWRNVMPKHVGNVKVSLEILRDAVSKAYVISDATYNGIDFFVKPESLAIKTEVQDTGMSCDIAITAESNVTFSDDNRIRFNGRLLKRMIQQLEEHAEGEMQLDFSITNQSKAVTVQLESQPNITVLLMPINIL